MSTRALLDGAESFDVTVLERSAPARVVLFAVGLGGNPERHLPLLESLAGRGCVVVAPHFQRLASAIPTLADLQLRARRLRLALDAVNGAALPVAGVGHSVGAAMLLALAGAQAWTIRHERVAAPVVDRLDRLALMAPATDFFRAPGAFDRVRAPILAWAGAADTVVTPEKVRLIEHCLAPRVPVETRVIDGAGHFSFMNQLPPHIADPFPDRDAFLADLAAEVGRFVTDNATS
ncbi:MAG TPA: alpha/beta hydrolase [Polyangia bacterium]